MAANRGVGTLFLVLLLSSWPETNLQPINTSSGPTTGGSISLKTQDLRAVVGKNPWCQTSGPWGGCAATDEILVQEILERNKSKLPDTYRTASTLSRVHTEKKKRILVRFRTSLSLRTARSHRPLLKKRILKIINMKNSPFWAKSFTILEEFQKIASSTREE
ncbi:sperm acrosome-associated protein 7 isoform X3 [Fukomys damarensis]|uniref:sperm acrosome-associated protein 7 isoform X3 n=1 Tax=Fukomys damarensis TaxID=885580 RepID=UPI00053F4E82|nr:sperm acrosome-associated protein 7 isoform X3 [Fukomys damarensis]